MFIKKMALRKGGARPGDVELPEGGIDWLRMKVNRTIPTGELFPTGQEAVSVVWADLGADLVVEGVTPDFVSYGENWALLPNDEDMWSLSMAAKIYAPSDDPMDVATTLGVSDGWGAPVSSLVPNLVDETYLSSFTQVFAPGRFTLALGLSTPYAADVDIQVQIFAMRLGPVE